MDIMIIDIIRFDIMLRGIGIYSYLRKREYRKLFSTPSISQELHYIHNIVNNVRVFQNKALSRRLKLKIKL